ncbi:hypothetical protein NUH87_29425 [Pseudomonas batumici]|uniref:hypothetical protein n=1 Tax=Pseudomonas batumici TaxID=226910 RepID=UPI0030CE5116
MSYTMSVDRVIQLSRCDDFPEATIRQMFAAHKATELPLPVLATLEIPLSVKVFLALQDEFFSPEEFRELAVQFAKRAAAHDTAVAGNHFVTSALAAYDQLLTQSRAKAVQGVLAKAAMQVSGYRAAVKAMIQPDANGGVKPALQAVAAYEAVWFAGYETNGIACRNAASCAVAAVPKPQADAELQWVLKEAVDKTLARAA